MRARIRAAAPADIERIAAIEAESFSCPWPAADFRREMENSWARLWVGEADSGVAGYLLAWFIPPQAELHKVAVAEGFRRQGVAVALLDHMLAEARQGGVETVWLEVREGNRAAIRLYERTGFLRAGRRRDYYQGPREDALVFQLDLAGEADGARRQG